MRCILYVITKAELGGAQSHVADLIEGLRPMRDADARRTEIHLAVGAEGALADRARAQGVAVHLLSHLKRPIDASTDARAVREFARLVRRVRPDIVHAHSSKAGIVARLAGLRTGVPTVFTVHGWGFNMGKRRPSHALAWLIEAACAPLSARIICVSNIDRALAIRARVAPGASIVTIHNGIDASAPHADPTLDPPRFLMVARFNEQKDQPTLLRALALLEQPRANVPYTVDFVGSGPDFETSRDLSRELGVEHRVRFLGDRTDVSALLSQSQALILATHFESLPISILEAMRAGLPVIATDVGGIREEIAPDQTGLLVPHEDARALADALQSLIDDPQKRARMGRAAREKFLAEFTREQMLAQVETLYNEILAPQTGLNPKKRKPQPNA